MTELGRVTTHLLDWIAFGIALDLGLDRHFNIDTQAVGQP